MSAHDDLSSLDAAFEVPMELVDDPKLRSLYEVIVARMRKEAAHVPMSTVQQLLIERIAFNYIVLRQKERKPIGSKDGFAHATIQKDWNTFWLATTQQFNALLAKTDKPSEKAMAGEIRDMLLKVVENLPEASQEQRQFMLEKFAEGFENLGVL